MRTVISDVSCLIDMAKGGLIEAMFDLPYRFAIPKVMYESELVVIPNIEKEDIKNLGLKTSVLPKDAVSRAKAYVENTPSLSLNDCSALVLAEETPDSILLTGDRRLRNVASEIEIEVHGSLWIIDQMHACNIVKVPSLLKALDVFKNDKAVFLPDDEIQKRVKRLSQLR